MTNVRPAPNRPSPAEAVMMTTRRINACNREIDDKAFTERALHVHILEVRTPSAYLIILRLEELRFFNLLAHYESPVYSP
jgi:hypothetical protein